MEKRIENIDIAKGIGIILMVIGHACYPHIYIFNCIYIFHMPLFFFLSGFLFKESSTHKPISYIYKKIKSLYLQIEKFII